MAARILYFGRDTCHRLPVLVRTGYTVENYSTTDDLRAALQAATPLGAVLMADTNPRVAQHAISLVRASLTAPLILFRDSGCILAESPFDLVIPSLTPPAEWLADIASLVAQCCLPAPSVRPRSAAFRLHADSAGLPRESAHPARHAAESSPTAAASQGPFCPPTLRSPLPG